MLGNVVVKAIILLMSLTHGEAAAAAANDIAIVQTAVPGYAKWGRLAMEETAKAYSGASIIDYKYEGRSERGQGMAEEKFRLWLRESDREFGVRVTITVEIATDTSRGVRFEELTH
ncbi:DUF3889 domain-containing protein [Paenibacillus sp. LHD-117]|uniref:DUF3889 domain-containing protein n=1 Tax=Paenibacillus sp. LHD-117 TaxID=3071412 RepID=UPI0027DFDE48|nr:DUF3889 domain-containing protein [Paenibacillus sp. LHD-117]MDQ6419155.1 DUF3889 domain-containing protein [Paenibacillus sp. LHD-117]